MSPFLMKGRFPSRWICMVLQVAVRQLQEQTLSGFHEEAHRYHKSSQASSLDGETHRLFFKESCRADFTRPPES